MSGFNSSPTELTTAATDALLGVLALFCVGLLQRYRATNRWKVGIWTWVLLALAAAALLGAMVHGLELRAGTREFLWRPLFLLLGLVVALFLVAASYDWLGGKLARRVLLVMIPVAVGFFVITQVAGGAFLLFIVYEAVAMFAALGIYVSLAIHRRLPGATLIAIAILLNIAAAAVQASGSVGFTLIWPFDHNGVFHIVQMIAVVVLMLGLHRSLQTGPDEQPHVDSQSLGP
jgi:hypothetical protein